MDHADLHFMTYKSMSQGCPKYDQLSAQVVFITENQKKTLIQNFLKISKSVTLISRSLLWVMMVQHKTSAQYLTSGKVSIRSTHGLKRYRLLKTLTKTFNILSNADADTDAVVTAIALPVLLYRRGVFGISWPFGIARPPSSTIYLLNEKIKDNHAPKILHIANCYKLALYWFEPIETMLWLMDKILQFSMTFQILRKCYQSLISK